MILPQKSQSSIICSSHVSIGLLLSKIASLKDHKGAEEYAEESDYESVSTASTAERNIILYHSAKSLRTDIKVTAAELRKNRNTEDDPSACMKYRLMQLLNAFRCHCTIMWPG